MAGRRRRSSRFDPTLFELLDRHHYLARAEAGVGILGWSSTVPTLPIGYLITVTLVALGTLFAVAPPRPRQSSPSNLSYWFGFLVNELPFVAFYWLLASTLLAIGQGDIDSPGGWAAFGLAVLTTVGLVVVAWRGLRASTCSIPSASRRSSMRSRPSPPG